MLAFADHGKVKNILPPDGGYAEAVIAEFTREGINDEALADELQREGTAAFEKSWGDLMSRINVICAASAMDSSGVEPRHVSATADGA